MIEKLHIENFGPIKNAELDIKRFMVLIGPQASGKSTIAKLLAIFRNIETYGRDSKDLSVSDMSKYFQNYGMAEYFNNGATKLRYTNGTNYEITYQDYTWTLNRSETFEAELARQKGTAEAFIKVFVESNDRLKGAAEKDKEETFKKLYEANWKNLFHVNNEQIYIPAERILISLLGQAAFSLRSAAIPVSLQEFGTKFEFATKRFGEYSIEHLGIKYVNEDVKGHRIYINESKSISLVDSSSGIQALVPLQMVIDYVIEFGGKTNHTFFVEEPELNLFPSTQEAVIKHLVKKYNTRKNLSGEDIGDNHFVIATHSPYALTAINNLLMASDTSTISTQVSEEVEKIVPKEFWLNANDFNAYSISKGEAQQIFDEEVKLIKSNFLDKISLDISGKSDQLMELYKSSVI